MIKYVCLVKQRLGSFVSWNLKHIPIDSNEKAYALAAVAASLPIKQMVFLSVYYQAASSITTNRVNQVDEACSSWLTPIVQYLSSGELSDNRIEA